MSQPTTNNTIQPVTQRFTLREATCKEIRSMTPKFGFNGLGEVVFRRTYSRNNESWHDVVIRVIQGVMSIRKEHFFRNTLSWNDDHWQTHAHDMAVSLFKMEWLPPGRGLWMMGTDFVYERGSMALNNCFTRDTKFWTMDGLKSFEDYNDGDLIKVRGRDKWCDATVKSFGLQDIWELKIMMNGRIQSIFTTSGHRWLAKTKKGDGRYTFKIKNTVDLEEGWKLQKYAKRTNYHHLEVCPIGIQHGIVFGDGALNKTANTCQIQLCGDKTELNDRFFSVRKDNTCITGLPNNWKNLPSLSMNKDYLLGFMAGWFATDGSIDKKFGMSLCNSDPVTLQWARDALFILDILSGPINMNREFSPFTGEYAPCYRVNIRRTNVPEKFFLRKSQHERFTNPKKDLYWRVLSVIKTDRTEDVWCVVEPENEEFTLENGIVTKNCSATDTAADLVLSAEWTMDGLMNGVGVGFSTTWRGTATAPDKDDTETVVIDDSREGWVESLTKLLCSYIHSNRHGTNKFPKFDYSQIRPPGKPIKGFGGTSSGPGPLKKMHDRIVGYLDCFCAGFIEVDGVQKEYNHTRLVADIFNAIGACVVAGNVRRSAEIALGDIGDETFIDLKNYEKNPERGEIGWMSNNSVRLTQAKEYEDFSYIPDLAKRIRDNGEPGMINLYNIQKFGRYGKEMKDDATLVNPCGEIPLCSFELCNLAESFPPRCETPELFFKALEYATFYSSTVSLLPTHRPETNAIMAKNRRIGISISGIAQWASGEVPEGWGHMNYTRLTKFLRQSYKIVRETNARLAGNAGVPPAIRCTTVKPSGSISLLAGVTAGVHYPVSRFAIRRMRIGQDSPLVQPLIDAGIPWEKDSYSDNTLVFEFAIDHGNVRPCEEVSPWEQFGLVAMIQRCYSDNCVSATVYFDKEKDGADVEKLLAMYIPILKSVSMLPHSGAGYAQMPYEKITEEQYEARRDAYKRPEFAAVTGNVPVGSRFCSGDTCEL